ncbi:hypothetical protein [Vagococcus xieshaowenii]|uniref:DUF7832 domain-containing protein n=1 Tax=Vagococcus xieshaowenii TaxID=2562451 RepID=A0AAJ5EGK3_9ENTE|nr:hypothetical protein [Vagococcus xieshaowenii]QCA29310.1 hypothetical protein E4Z98_08265 [Vagococcus xieshaowenii]TFZ41995.1 hypothetical protein E4031_04240 [Vagococcus xieshaowenii]
MAIDKAIWHYEVPDYPKELPNEQGGVHIAFFFRWMAENGFSGSELNEEYPAIQMKLKLTMLDAFDILMTFFDGTIMAEDFNETGARFANAYYLEKELYSRDYGNYLEDYEALMPSLKHLEGFETFYQGVIYSEENYQIVKKLIDQRYEEYETWLNQQEESLDNNE